MNTNILIDLIGWLGASLILVAYYLISSKKTSSDSKAYQMLNLIGAIALIINTYAKGAIPPAVLNLIWAIIALKSLLKK